MFNIKLPYPPLLTLITQINYFFIHWYIVLFSDVAIIITIKIYLLKPNLILLQDILLIVTMEI